MTVYCKKFLSFQLHLIRVIKFKLPMKSRFIKRLFFFCCTNKNRVMSPRANNTEGEAVVNDSPVDCQSRRTDRSIFSAEKIQDRWFKSFSRNQHCEPKKISVRKTQKPQPFPFIRMYFLMRDWSQPLLWRLRPFLFLWWITALTILR